MKKIDLMNLEEFLCGIAYATAYPSIHIWVMSAVNSRMMSTVNLLTNIAITIVAILWNKYGSKLFKYYKVFLILETILEAIVCIVSVYTGNALAYYISDSIIYSLITRHIIAGGNRIRANRYKTPESRSKYDNNAQMLSSIAGIIGPSLAFILNPSISTSIIIGTVSCTLDNAFMWVFHSECRKGNTL